MSSNWGKILRISIFGESHARATGVNIDGLPAGEHIDLGQIALQMSRRAPGQDQASTHRKEPDIPEILTGLSDEGFLTGAPLCAIIGNSSQHSRDYDNLRLKPRPGHADFPAFIKYNGHNDIRGGGHFSGRLTAAMVFAGAVCRQILERRGVVIAAHALEIASIRDKSFELSPDKDLLNRLNTEYFPVIDMESKEKMYGEIAEARSEGDSVGGIVECVTVGLPAGMGSPIFDGIENRIASIVFGIPAIKGIEFGAGFAAAGLKGSENNDQYRYELNNVRSVSNNAGGILGGISTGMPLLFKAAIKPTPSISKMQGTVDLFIGKNAELSVKGRHDPCIVPRAVPVIEAATAIALMDIWLEERGYQNG